MTKVSQKMSPSQDTPVTGSLLATKLYIPRVRRDLVARPRLIDRLNDGLHRKLSLIAAPAGFGKTTLLAGWIPQSERCVTWVSLDAADNDPIRFFTYVIAALQLLQPDLAQPVLEQLNSPQPSPVESLLPQLLNHITAFPDRFALVLEDYHLIETQAIHSSITFLLEHLPPHMHLIITSRADPPLSLARLRVRGQLTEIRAADLRFTSEEISNFFNQLYQFQLEQNELVTLESRTEGWVAGLQLAALSLQEKQNKEVSAFVKSFAGDHRYVLDYLAEEVLHQQPEYIQRFLLQTSVLNRLSGALCDALLESGDERLEIELEGMRSAGQEILEQLEASNLFLAALDDQRLWYRYHHLFADFLRERLGRQVGESGLARLYSRASVWCEEHGLMDEAISYALAARDWSRAVQLVEQMATAMWKDAQYPALRRWLETLPQEVLSASPKLCLWYAWTLVLYGQFQAYKQPLQIAEQIWQRKGNRAKLGEVFHVRTVAAYLQRDSAATLDNAQQALTYLDDNHFIGDIDRCFQAMSYLFTGQIATAEQKLLELKNNQAAVRVPRVPFIIQSGFGEIKQLQGRLSEAIRIWRDVTEAGGIHLPLLLIRLLGSLGELYYEQNDLAQAETTLQQSLELAKRTDREIFGVWSYVTWARLLWLKGNLTEAFASIDRALSLVQNLDYPFPRRHLSAWQARLWLLQGRLSEAVQWAVETGLAVDDDLKYERQVEYLTLARVLLARDEPEQARHLLDRLIETAEEAGRTGDTVEMLALTALAHQAQGETDAALTGLEQALTRAEPGGYIRTFVDEGEAMRALLSAVNRQPSAVSRTYMTNLLAAFDPEKAPQIGAPAPPLPGPAALIEPLSERELEVLHLIVNGATNKEIAQTLFITVNTVKKHVTNIFGKLGVSRRPRAIARARELGLTKD